MTDSGFLEVLDDDAFEVPPMVKYKNTISFLLAACVDDCAGLRIEPPGGMEFVDQERTGGGLLSYGCKNKFDASSNSTYPASHTTDAPTRMNEANQPLNSHNSHLKSKSLLRKVIGNKDIGGNELVARCIRSEVIADNSIAAAFNKSASSTETNSSKNSKARTSYSPLLRNARSEI